MILFFLFCRLGFSLEGHFEEREDFDLILPIYKSDNMHIYNQFFANLNNNSNMDISHRLANHFRQSNVENSFSGYLIPLIHFKIIQSRAFNAEEIADRFPSFLEFMYCLKYKEYFYKIKNGLPNNIYFKTSVHFFMKVNHLSEILLYLYLPANPVFKAFCLHLKKNIQDFKNCNLDSFDTIEKFRFFIIKITNKTNEMSTEWISMFNCDTTIIIYRIISLLFNVSIFNNFEDISFNTSFNTKVIKNSIEINNKIYSYQHLNSNLSFEDILTNISIIGYNRLIRQFTNLQDLITTNARHPTMARKIKEMPKKRQINIEDTLQSFRDIINQTIHIYRNPRYEEFNLDFIELICQSIYVEYYDSFCEIEYARVWGFCMNRYKRLMYNYSECILRDQHTLSYHATIILCIEYSIFDIFHPTRIFLSDCLIFNNIDQLKIFIAKKFPKKLFPPFLTKEFLLFHVYSKCEFILQFCISDFTYITIVEDGLFYDFDHIIIALLVSFCLEINFSVQFFLKNLKAIVEISESLKLINPPPSVWDGIEFN